MNTLMLAVLLACVDNRCTTIEFPTMEVCQQQLSEFRKHAGIVSNRMSWSFCFDRRPK